MKKKWFLILGASAVLLGFSNQQTQGVAAADSNEFEDPDTDAVVIDAVEDNGETNENFPWAKRNGKQYFAYLPQSLFTTYILPDAPKNGVEQPSAHDTTCVTNQGKNGNCESFEKCYPLLNLPEDETVNGTANYSNLQEEVYHISIDGKCSSVVHAGASTYSNVCCDIAQPYVADNEKPKPEFLAIPIEKDDDEDLDAPVSPKYSKIVNTWATCGEKQFDIKIIGGENSAPHEYPWMVSLWGKSGKHICGASVIDNEYVLTAAHCIAKYTSQDVSKIRLYFGDHNIHSTSDGHHEVRSVSRIIKHKHFSFQTFVNDIALLKLDRPVAFSNRIRPICLPSGTRRIDDDPRLVVAGWGQTSYKGTSSSVLRKVTVPGVTNKICGGVYNNIAPAGITNDMVCAGGNGVDSCIGDSGGPLIQYVNNKYEQIGIVSFGKECGTYPGVYTKVYSFLNWIGVNRKKY